MPKAYINLDREAPRITTTAVQTSLPSKPWQSYLTFDLILRVLSRSIFHPFIIFVVLMCLRAIHYEYESPAFIAISAWGGVLVVARVAMYLNFRVAYGRPREVDFEEEVVVITGGKSGLGKLIAEVYGMRGVAIAALDIGVSDEEDGEDMEGVRYYKCDVGDREQVEKVKGRIEKDLGPPTILINNAAASITPSPITTTSASYVSKTLTTNTLAHFNTLSAFLPSLLSSPTGGTIVTISSILSHFTPAHFSAYSASKAAVSALHESLRAELRLHPNGGDIKTLLVETGQMRTPLFSMVETPSPFWGPVLEANEVASAIVQLVDAGEGGCLRLPAYAGFVSLYKVLPGGLQRFARWLSGIDTVVKGQKVPKVEVREKEDSEVEPEAGFVHVGDD